MVANQKLQALFNRTSGFLNRLAVMFICHSSAAGPCNPRMQRAGIDEQRSWSLDREPDVFGGPFSISSARSIPRWVTALKDEAGGKQRQPNPTEILDLRRRRAVNRLNSEATRVLPLLIVGPRGVGP
jgi:hypothetical protein